MATASANPTTAPRMSSDSEDLFAPRRLRKGAVEGALSPAEEPARERLTERSPEPIPSFREIYDNCFGFVWRSAANRGVPSSALGDVAQEVFSVINRKLPEFEGRSSLRLWIASIVRRVVADYV